MRALPNKKALFRDYRISQAILHVTFALIFLSIFLLLAIGCSVGPKYARPVIQSPASYKEVPQSAASGSDLWRTAQPRDGVSRGKWWEVFDDPQLNELEDEASASNREVAAAVDNFLAARALVREARSQYFPAVGTTPSIINSRPSPGQFGGLQAASGGAVSVKSFTDYSLPFDASWEPDFWGRVRSSVKANIYAAQATAADLQNTLLSVQAELAVDYYELRAQDSLKALLDSTVVNYQDAFDMTRSQFTAGLASGEAMAQAEAQLKAAQAQDTNLGILRAQYEHAMATLTGKPASSFSLSEKALTANPPITPAGVPSELLERRPDIAAAERSVAEANAQIGAAKTAYFPAILLSASGGFGTSSFIDWFTWPSRFLVLRPEHRGNHL